MSRLWQSPPSGVGRVVGNLLISLGGLCIAGAVGLVAYNYHVDRLAGIHCESIVTEFQSLVTSTKPVEVLPAGMPSTSYLTADTVKNEGVTIQGASYLGLLEAPMVGMTLPIHLNWSEKNLTSAPCTYWGSLAEEDLVIAGHNYRSHFANLQDMLVGDPITITDTNGNIYSYQVDQVFRLHESEKAYLLDREPWALTLYTCDYPDGEYRIVVRCVAT